MKKHMLMAGILLLIIQFSFADAAEVLLGRDDVPRAAMVPEEIQVTPLQVELKFYQQTYRLNEPFPVMIQVVNNSDTKAAFSLSSLIHETFFFQVRTPKNEDTPLLDYFQAEMKENTSSSGDFREVTLQPQECFSRVIDISKWFEFKEAGYYYIKGVFYPNPDKRNESVESFNYKILIKPPSLVEKQLSEDQQLRVEQMESAQLLPPYDVISDMLDAKMKKDWERFLAHIDAERLISAFKDYYDAYENARSGRYRLEVIEDFKKYLTVHWQDRILGYKIIESQITENKATVICDVDYRMKLYEYSMRYTFNLYKNHMGHWLVNDYTAMKTK